MNAAVSNEASPAPVGVPASGQRLRSYVCGQWHDGTGDTTDLVNPTTEATLGLAVAGGIDIAAAFAHARGVGGPALRELTFAQRGELLGAMAKVMHEARDELLELSIANGGNTRGDAKFDVDGASGTLAYYAKLGAQLGDRRVALDGEPEGLSRNPRLIGQHVRVPLHGLALHINAFNFPAWGMAEKAAVALLAGVPVVSKAATSTGLLAARMVELWVNAKVLPHGALSFLGCRSAGLLEALGPQDAVAFTGSAATGVRVRGHEQVLRCGTRVSVEADSLNAAVLAPDLERESDAYDLFLREVAREITQKAGQKCTATRRIFVPRTHLEGVIEDLGEMLSNTTVGDPSQRGVRMGPLCTRQQLADAREGLAKLQTVAKVVHGDASGGRGKLQGVDDERGYFMAPVLLCADDAAAAAPVHEHEVFAPVATVMPYEGLAKAALPAVQAGAGSLVTSLYTDDVEAAAAFVHGAASYSGRVHIAGTRIAEHSNGPGMVLPQMVHGGPGRAGGGEELGGTRGLAFYTQRCGLQGFAPMIEKIA